MHKDTADRHVFLQGDEWLEKVTTGILLLEELGKMCQNHIEVHVEKSSHGGELSNKPTS